MRRGFISSATLPPIARRGGRMSLARLVSGSGLVGLSIVLGLFACNVENADPSDSAAFRRGTHSLLPPDNAERTPVGTTDVPVDEQPLAFNHAIHAGSVDDGGMGMDCQYCHSNARRSPAAGVPATQVCWNCHKMVDSTDRPALVALGEYCGAAPFAPTCVNEDPIPWNRVHDLPDYVRFNHAAHVQPGPDGEQRVACQECHGNMEERDVAHRENTLLMGWCLDCHENHESVNTNYGAGAELRRAELKDCYTCHK